MTDPKSYDEIDTAFAEEHSPLGAEYSAANRLSEVFLSEWTEEHAEGLAEDVMRPIMDVIYDRVWGAFRDSLLSDTEMNIQSHMRDMVEKSVTALIGGQEWANIKYIKPGAYRSEDVRATLAKLYSDEIKDGRIADLEREVENLRQKISYMRR
tara:strand:+ start:491 stop:949 length:459 start_codon:yes stop_codon:yes gene_type:complete